MNPTVSVDDAFAARNWAASAVGAPETWPQSLRTAVSICRESRFPIILFWGPELVQFYNEAYRPILGTKHPHALGQRAEDCWPEIWSSIGPMLRGVLDRGEATWSEDLMLPLAKDGTPGEFYFTFSYSPIRDEEGIGGVFCAVTETTERVLLARESEKRERELTELNRAKSTFFSNITHEFRTPLSLMLGPLEIAHSRALDESSREAIGGASRNAQRLLKLVNSLLAFARIEAGRLEPRFSPTDIAAYTGELVSPFESLANRSGLQLTFERNASVTAYVDREMWEHIVFNLLSNAIKYTHEGAVRLSIDADERDVVLQVRDTGIGIPPEHLSRVFERFYRVPTNEGRTAEGAGIGLALTKELVEQHRGSIVVESNESGSQFTVRIPLGTAHLDARTIVTEDIAAPAAVEQFVAEAGAWLSADSNGAGEERPLSDASILLVDDNADLRAHMTRLLGGRYRVRSATDGVEALRIIERERPDLVLSDVMMPRMDGNELVQRIRQLPSGEDIAVVLLSARGDQDEIADALEGGADDYIPKPFVGSELLARVATQLRLQRTRREAERTAREAATVFETLADILPGMIWMTDATGTRNFNNAAWRTFTGISPGEELWTKMHPEDVAMVQESFDAAKRSKRPFRADYRLWHAASQRYRWVTINAYETKIASDVRWVGTIIDIEDRKRRELANAFLAEGGAVLNQSLDLSETLMRLASLANDSLSDYCVFYIVGQNERVARAVWLHRDAEAQMVLNEAIAHAPDPNDPEWMVARVIATNEPSNWARGQDMVRSETQHPRYTELIERLDLSGVAVCPVHLGSTVYGALALARCGDREPFDDFDIETLMQLADRAAIAVANADLFEREHRIALSFQNAALPSHLPQRAGVRVNAHYVAGRSEARVGGDWYDVELLADGRVMLSIGDVSGSGLDAAVVMSMVRNAMRSVAHVYADPATILEAAQRATEHRIGEHFVTAFVAIVDPVIGRLTYCNAGHTPPILRDGTRVYEIESEGLPLGVGFEREWRTEMMKLPGESVLVLYTDGLTEGAGAFLPGEAALQEYIASNAFLLDMRAESIYNTLLPNGSRDDTAVLVARISAHESEASTVRMPFAVREPIDATRARDRICEELSRVARFSIDAMQNARLVVGELTANIARHARGDAVAIIDTAPATPVLHLVDNGAGFRYSNRLPPNIFAESGRGLFIASALARHLEVLPDIDGGSHVIAVLDLS